MTTTKTVLIALVSAIAGALLTLLYTHFTVSTDVICKDYSADAPSELTTQLIHDMVQQYKSVQYKSIVTAATTPVPDDARAIWFDLETIKKFIFHIEQEVTKNTNGNTTSAALGIRIYYAAYPDNKRMEELGKFQKDASFIFNPDYEGLHTLVMIPTIVNEEGNNMDFNPVDPKTYEGFTTMPEDEKYPFVSNINSVLGLGATGTSTSSGGGTSTSARNHGTLSPPNTEIGFSF